ncbi:acetyl-CoA acetyltransferase [Anopheles sinensis]|uniref:Acetyl-CoA acetyltransferase n=1 Tax=Anopheles sinensis TaxID=74873 RepID=A0A084WSD9_ANOSI|nr:acetyl-CoA acetyltransferase [Anopheles sinensis]
MLWSWLENRERKSRLPVVPSQRQATASVYASQESSPLGTFRSGERSIRARNKARLVNDRLRGLVMLRESRANEHKPPIYRHFVCVCPKSSHRPDRVRTKPNGRDGIQGLLENRRVRLSISVELSCCVPPMLYRCHFEMQIAGHVRLEATLNVQLSGAKLPRTKPEK